MTNPKRVLLVGFMGSGKSSVGRELAPLLGWRFYDFDQAVEERVGETVSTIFSTRGEEYFRGVESDVAEELLAETSAVLATGGGWPAQPGNWEIVPDNTMSVWLRVSSGVAIQRASREGPLRPLLEGEGAEGRVDALYQIRQTSYARAQHSLDSERHNPRELAGNILELIDGKRDQAMKE
ncbi:MAG: shikimate kinase [Gemmatimonadota bacterium]|nr:shikimate kinase [Gemmatimonadota bacterium]